MLSSNLYYRVESITDEIVDINSYMFTKVMITVPRNISIPAYVESNIVSTLKPGGYYFTERAYMTGIGGVSPMTRELSFRIDYTEEITKEVYNAIRETVVRVNGIVKNGPKNYIKYTGPMRVPILVTTIAVRNESKQTFHLMLVGFHNKAEKLISLGKSYYADIVGKLYSKNPEKPCSLIVCDIIFRKEVK